MTEIFVTFWFVVFSVLRISLSSVCSIPENLPSNPIDTQDQTWGVLSSYYSRIETPLIGRLTTATDSIAWNCLATYSMNILDMNTKERPVLSNNIPRDLMTTTNRVICSVYGYATLWQDIVGDFTTFEELFQSYGLLSVEELQPLINQVESCNGNVACLNNLGNSGNYCGEIMGIIVGSQVNDWLAKDGWNAKGLETPFGECTANCRPYSDSIGFYDERIRLNENAVYEGSFKWKNLLEDDGLGFFYKQEHVTPHIGYVAVPRSLSRVELDDRIAPKPKYNYKIEAPLLVKRVGDLAENDTMKSLVEFFDDKLNIATIVIFTVTERYNLSWELRQLFVAGYVSSEYDTVVLSWKEKVRHNRIRPTTIVQSSKYTPNFINTWGGPFQGLKTIRAADFQPYIRVMPHAEYPSASGCICKGISQFTDAFLKDQFGDDSTSITFTFPSFLQRQSRVEPGAMPANNETLVFNFSNMKKVYETCAESRLWAGLHFTDAITAADQLCDGIGTNAYSFMKSLLNGETLL